MLHLLLHEPKGRGRSWARMIRIGVLFKSFRGLLLWLALGLYRVFAGFSRGDLVDLGFRLQGHRTPWSGLAFGVFKGEVQGLGFGV